MSPFDDLTPEVLAATRAHPAFRDAVMLNCASRVRAQGEMDDLARWMTRDFGRYGLAVATAILDGQPQGVTTAALIQTMSADGGVSRGRASHFVEHARRRGGLTIPPGDEHWTRRRLVVHPKLVNPLLDHCRGSLRAAALIFPGLEPGPAQLGDHAWMVQFMTVSAALAKMARNLLVSPDYPMSLFLDRDGGMAIFCDLFCRQAPERSRLLESVPLSRKGLAQRADVSRTQIQRLLSEGVDGGLLSYSVDRIDFAPTLSEDAERHFAVSFRLARLAVSFLPGAGEPAGTLA